MTNHQLAPRSAATLQIRQDHGDDDFYGVITSNAIPRLRDVVLRVLPAFRVDAVRACSRALLVACLRETMEIKNVVDQERLLQWRTTPS